MIDSINSFYFSVFIALSVLSFPLSAFTFPFLLRFVLSVFRFPLSPFRIKPINSAVTALFIGFYKSGKLFALDSCNARENLTLDSLEKSTTTC